MRLMGRNPSQLTLEVAMQTHPNLVIISEKITSQHLSLKDVINKIADVVEARSKEGKNFGTVLIPEGLAASIPELRILINEIDNLYRVSKKEVKLFSTSSKGT